MSAILKTINIYKTNPAHNELPSVLTFEVAGGTAVIGKYVDRELWGVMRETRKLNPTSNPDIHWKSYEKFIHLESTYNVYLRCVSKKNQNYSLVFTFTLPYINHVELIVISDNIEKKINLHDLYDLCIMSGYTENNHPTYKTDTYDNLEIFALNVSDENVLFCVRIKKDYAVN